MGRSAQRGPVALLVLGVLCGAPGALRAQDPPPQAPAPVPASAADATARATLEKEMQEVYAAVRRDFDGLRGEGAGSLLARVAAAVPAGKPDGPALVAAWTADALLCPAVAQRLAAAFVEQRTAGTATGAAALIRDAATSVFPEATMDRNWDLHFLDLDVVRRWRAAHGEPDSAAGPSTADGDRGAAAPARSASAYDAADMVAVPRGDLQIPENRGRGYPNLSQKATREKVLAFHIDRTEVSCAAYAEFLSTVKNARVRERITPTTWPRDEQGHAQIPAGHGQFPVAGIPYEGAHLFAEHHGKRLPTEEEWERAARGDEGLLYPWGAEWKEGHAVVETGGKGPAPVGSTPTDRSPFGALDMAGNVSEVCATYRDGKPVKGLPKETEQVVRRGGNYDEPAADAANDYRFMVGATSMAGTPLVGFRCAMDERDYRRRFGK